MTFGVDQTKVPPTKLNLYILNLLDNTSHHNHPANIVYKFIYPDMHTNEISVQGNVETKTIKYIEYTFLIQETLDY